MRGKNYSHTLRKKRNNDNKTDSVMVSEKTNRLMDGFVGFSWKSHRFMCFRIANRVYELHGIQANRH